MYRMLKLQAQTIYSNTKYDGNGNLGDGTFNIDIVKNDRLTTYLRSTMDDNLDLRHFEEINKDLYKTATINDKNYSYIVDFVDVNFKNKSKAYESKYNIYGITLYVKKGTKLEAEDIMPRIKNCVYERNKEVIAVVTGMPTIPKPIISFTNYFTYNKEKRIYEYKKDVEDKEPEYVFSSKIKKIKIYVRRGFNVDFNEIFSNMDDCIYKKSGKICAVIVNYPVINNNLGKEDKFFKYNEDKKIYEYRSQPKKGIDEIDKPILPTELRKEFYDNGFKLNIDGEVIEYKRYKRSASHAKSGNCLFINKKYYDEMMLWSYILKEFMIDPVVKNHPVEAEAYSALSLSNLIGTIELTPRNILIMKDIDSEFEEECINVTIDNNDLVAKKEKVKIKNTIWDGEGLLDSSVFEKNGMKNKGMMVLRNRFFKCCCFNTNLQQWFKENKIYNKNQLNGYTKASNISDIKLVITYSSLKFIKFSDSKVIKNENNSIDLDQIDKDVMSEWMKGVDRYFGLVKFEKPTHFFDGNLVQTSYQIINSLDLDDAKIDKLCNPYSDYLKNIKSDSSVFKYYISQKKAFSTNNEEITKEDKKDEETEVLDNEKTVVEEPEEYEEPINNSYTKYFKYDDSYDGVSYEETEDEYEYDDEETDDDNKYIKESFDYYDEEEFINRKQQLCFDLLNLNNDFDNTKIYSELVSDTINKIKETVNTKGKVLVPGTYATIFGNGYEMLKNTIKGKYKITDEPCLKGNEVITEMFEKNENLVGARSPHITMGNLLLIKNTHKDEYDKWFNLSKEIICVNAINFNIQQRLNGMDYDSDTLLITNDKSIYEATKKNYDKFLVPVNLVKPDPGKDKDLSIIDQKISDNLVGEIVNLSQKLNSILWDKYNKNENYEEIYLDICKLAILSGMEIDKAKRSYPIDSEDVLTSIRKKYSNYGKPLFMDKLSKIKNNKTKNKDTKVKTESYKTPMERLSCKKLDSGGRGDGKRVHLYEIMPKHIENELLFIDSNKTKELIDLLENGTKELKKYNLSLYRGANEATLDKLLSDLLDSTLVQEVFVNKCKIRNLLEIIVEEADKKFIDGSNKQKADKKNDYINGMTWTILYILDEGINRYNKGIYGYKFPTLYTLFYDNKEREQLKLDPNGDIVLFNLNFSKYSC